jgi:hypothetical protein
MHVWAWRGYEFATPVSQCFTAWPLSIAPLKLKMLGLSSTPAGLRDRRPAWKQCPYYGRLLAT